MQGRRYIPRLGFPLGQAGVGISILLICFALLASPSRAHGQAVIVRGDTFPAQPKEYTWFHNTKSFRVYLYADGHWASSFMDRKAKKVTACNAMVIFVEYDQAYYSCYTEHGERIYESINKIECKDDIVYSEMGNAIAIDARPMDKSVPLVARMISSEHRCPAEQPDTIRGKLYYCLPKWYPNINAALVCDEIHSWGLLGTNAEWLIQPIFDGPFHFVKGVADVMYYGEKRRINVKGEFVDQR